MPSAAATAGQDDEPDQHATGPAVGVVPQAGQAASGGPALVDGRAAPLPGTGTVERRHERVLGSMTV